MRLASSAVILPTVAAMARYRPVDTLRGQIKVDAQFKLFCLVHNIEKLAKAGYGTG